MIGNGLMGKGLMGLPGGGKGFMGIQGGGAGGQSLMGVQGGGASGPGVGSGGQGLMSGMWGVRWWGGELTTANHGRLLCESATDRDQQQSA